MRIAFIHFHLKTGGVTTVIREQVNALKGLGWEVLVLSGRVPEDNFPGHVCEIPGLAYEEELSQPAGARSVADNIIEAMHAQWSCVADIVHVHNPTLAKNRRLQAVLKKLQNAGLQLLCQIHDFAEDGRPNAFFAEPYAADCHYAVINGRDRSLLLQSGLTSRGVHLLPNPVPAMSSRSGSQLPRPGHVLYPVRAIRRKNIGEAILLSLYFGDLVPLAITLPPNSPMDVQSYRGWRNFVDHHQLRVDFEVGLKTEFINLVRSCRYVLTTSITEGFGFSFLETWSAGKALWGRLLPAICQDFINQGMRLDHLYPQLNVPLKWMDENSLARRWQAALSHAADCYGHPMEGEALESAWRIVSRNDCVDFGLLDEVAQKDIIEIVLSDKESFKQLLRMNPFLNHAGPPADCRDLIRHNQIVVARHYNPKAYAQRLRAIYASVMAHPVHQTIDKRQLIKAFLTPREFSLLKWGEYLG